MKWDGRKHSPPPDYSYVQLGKQELFAMANKALPKNVRLLRGTHQKCRHGDKATPEVKTVAKLPPPPKHLDATAKTEWNRVVDVCEALDILAATDMMILALYCSLWSRFVHATPDLPFNASDATQMRLCGAEMGFTPSARTKLSAPAKKTADEYADY